MTLLDLNAHWCPTNDRVSDRGDVLYLDAHLPWLLEAGEDFVDLGCGTGRTVSHIRTLGKRCEGITYQKEEVQRAASRGIALTHGDLHVLPWHGRIFDGALMWDALEHTLAPLVVLREARRVLRPGGRLLIFVPGETWIPTTYHIIVPNMKQMRHLLKLAGFARVRVHDYSHDDPEQAVYEVTK